MLRWHETMKRHVWHATCNIQCCTRYCSKNHKNINFGSWFFFCCFSNSDKKIFIAREIMFNAIALCGSARCILIHETCVLVKFPNFHILPLFYFFACCGKFLTLFIIPQGERRTCVALFCFLRNFVTLFKILENLH